MVTQMVQKIPGRPGTRTAALAAAAILTLVPLTAACGDGNGAADTSPAPTPTAIAPTTAQPTGTPPGNAPADPAAARKEIEKNWAAFFDPKTTTDEKVKLLENGEQMRPVLMAFAGDENAARTSAKVKNVTFSSPTQAAVTYDLLVAGTPALPDAKGQAVHQDNVWKVSRSTLCALVKLSGNAAVPGC
ncbi:hypothetical protein ACFPM3_09895 [Streptomyces coeruleoprunus]|uniref:Low molecular weight antigen MTB12-like C-terminal domain-containing protein n=1 Tax=Streptomyces coeruleoprunus TaxID=285563 RepID=A0ABV9XDP0_9ACTN